MDRLQQDLTVFIQHKYISQQLEIRKNHRKETLIIKCLKKKKSNIWRYAFYGGGTLVYHIC